MAGSVHQFWVFGYGSLIWNPGFAFIDRKQAMIRGYHRSLCMYSYMYRGTPERPGLVLGLDRGGFCHGVAYRVAPEAWERNPCLSEGARTGDDDVSRDHPPRTSRE